MRNFFKITSSLFMIFTISCSDVKNPPPGDSTGQVRDEQKTPQTPVHIQKFNDLVQQIRKLAEKIPHDSKSFFAGDIYNAFLKQAYDPHANMSPIPDPQKPQTYFGVGFLFTVFIENQENNQEQKQENNQEQKIEKIIIKPFKGSPAQAAGLKKGDIVISVDGVSIKEMSSLEEIKDRIMGPKDTKVTLGVIDFCNDQEKEVVLTRGPITNSPNMLEDSYFVSVHQEEIFKECETQSHVSRTQTESGDPGSDSEQKSSPSVIYTPLESFSVLYAPLRSFQNSAPSGRICKEFINLQRKDLQNPSSIGMIIDLRGNPGGNLFEVICMLDTIIPSKEVLVTQLPVEKGKPIENPSEILNSYFTEGGYPLGSTLSSYNRNIVVLVNGNSASASEIFAGTIQEMKRGWVVGSRTIGKGSVQRLFKRQFDGGRKLYESSTTGIYTLNSGRSPQGSGIIPDFSVSTGGDPIEIEADYISVLDKIFFNNIQFENNTWEQNRPDELAQVKRCVNKDGRLGKTYRESDRDKKYKHPFVSDYHIELAKDILLCSSVKNNFIEWSFRGGAFETRAKKMETPN